MSELLDKISKVIAGEVPEWETMSDEEKIKYYHPEYSQLEVDFEKLYRDIVIYAKVNWKLFYHIGTYLQQLRKIDKLRGLEMMYRITENENPLKIFKECYDIKDNIEIFAGHDESNKILKLSDSINIYVDYLNEYN